MLLTKHPTIHRTSFTAQYYLVPNVTSAELKGLWSPEWGSGVWLPVPQISLSHFLAVSSWATYYAGLDPSEYMNVISVCFAADARFKWANMCGTWTQSREQIISKIWLLLFWGICGFLSASLRWFVWSYSWQSQFFFQMFYLYWSTAG